MNTPRVTIMGPGSYDRVSVREIRTRSPNNHIPTPRVKKEAKTPNNHVPVPRFNNGAEKSKRRHSINQTPKSEILPTPIFDDYYSSPIRDSAKQNKKNGSPQHGSPKAHSPNKNQHEHSPVGSPKKGIIFLTPPFTGEHEPRIFHKGPERVASMEFRNGLYDKTKIQAELEDICEALYTLSVDHRLLSDVILAICNFDQIIPHNSYSHDNITQLLSSAKNCPPDAKLYIMLIGVIMISQKNIPTQKQQSIVLREACSLQKKLNSREKTDDPPLKFEVFANQREPKARLRDVILIYKFLRCPYGVLYSIEDVFHEKNLHESDFHDTIEFNDPELPETTDSRLPFQYISSSESDSDYDFLDQPYSVSSQEDILENIRNNNMNFLILNGSREFDKLTGDSKRRYLEIRNKYFSTFDTAHSGVYYLWDCFNNDKSFNLAIMLSIIDKHYMSFITYGLNSLSQKQTESTI